MVACSVWHHREFRVESIDLAHLSQVLKSLQPENGRRSTQSREGRPVTDTEPCLTEGQPVARAWFETCKAGPCILAMIRCGVLTLLSQVVERPVAELHSLGGSGAVRIGDGVRVTDPVSAACCCCPMPAALPGVSRPVSARRVPGRRGVPRLWWWPGLSRPRLGRLLRAPPKVSALRLLLSAAGGTDGAGGLLPPDRTRPGLPASSPRSAAPARCSISRGEWPTSYPGKARRCGDARAGDIAPARPGESDAVRPARADEVGVAAPIVAVSVALYWS